MGTVIRFCEKCGLRVPEEDIAKGPARALDDLRALCGQCAPGVPVAGDSAARRGSQVRNPAASGRSPAGSQRRENYRSDSNRMFIYIGAGVLVVLVPILLVMMSGSDSSKTGKKPASRPPETPKTVAFAPAPPSTKPSLAPAPPAKPASNAPEPASAPASAPAENNPGFNMTNFRDELANGEWGRLKTQAFSDETIRYRALTDFMNRYASTQAAREAAQIRDSLKVPKDFDEIATWSRLWSYGPTTTGLFAWHEQFKGRTFLLETHPFTPKLPMWTKRRMTVPDDRPFFETEVFGNEKGDREVWLEADGEAMPRVKSDRDQTYILALDLSERKGKEVEIALGHGAWGEWNSEHVYWSFPHFVKEPKAGAQVYKVTGAAPAPLPPVLLLPDDAAWAKGVNLLTATKPEEDTVRGTWRVENDKLLCAEHSQDAMLALPYEPPQEYDYRIRFTPGGGNHEVDPAIRVNGRSALWIMAGFGNTCSGFEKFEGKGANDNASTVRKKDFIVTNREYTCVLRIRREGLYAFLDGKLVSTLTTDGRNMDISSSWALTGKETRLGVGAQDSIVTFHAIDVIEVSGAGRMTR